MGSACSECGVRGETYTEIWWGNMRERDHLGGPGVDERIILIWTFRKWGVVVMGWIGLAEDRDRWRAAVSAVMNTEAPCRGKLKDRDHLGDTGVDGRVIRRWIFRKWDRDTDRWRALVNEGNEHSGSTKYGEFLD
jgi:hypothetical protein